MRTIGISILVIFYAIYLGKMILQKQKGIQTNQMAKKKQKNKIFYIELIMKIATYFIVPVEVISILVVDTQFPMWVTLTGVVLGYMGNVIFGLAVVTMRDSWRAGIAEEDKTEMVTNGIYQISRNPAFLGFDCVYLGILLMFFHPVLLLFTIFPMVMLHLQILQEEKFLTATFGKPYIAYKNKVCRYIGRKR